MVKPKAGKLLPGCRFMYVCPGDHPHSFGAIALIEDPEDVFPIGVRRVGGFYPNWSRYAFEKVDA